MTPRTRQRSERIAASQSSRMSLSTYGVNLLADQFFGFRTVTRSGGHPVCGGQPSRPLRLAAVIDGDGRRDLIVDQMPQVVTQRCTAVGRRADFAWPPRCGVEWRCRKPVAESAPGPVQAAASSAYLRTLQPQRLRRSR